MFIQTEPTPNPATLKFLPGETVMASGTAEFRSVEEAGVSPLAQRLFEIGGISGVFFGSEFVSVTQDGSRDWAVLKPLILGAIMEHYTAGGPVVLEVSHGEGEGDDRDGSEDSELVTQIKEILETRVRPVVARDGGDIVFHRFEDGVVYLTMRGACSGCPSSTMTLKHGIENLLRHFIPEVHSVEAVL